MAVLCWLCHKFASNSFKAVIRHIRAVHSFDPSFEIVCGINGCPRTYTKFNSYKKHLTRKHLDVYDPRMSRISSTCRTVDSSHSGAPHEADHDDLTRLPQQECASGPHIDSIVDNIEESSESSNEMSFANSEKLAALFLLKMKEVYKLSQSSVDCLTTDMSEMLQKHDHSLKLKVKDLLSSSGIKVENYPQIVQFLSHQDEELADPFKGLQSKFLQEKYFHENLALIVSANN